MCVCLYQKLLVCHEMFFRRFLGWIINFILEIEQEFESYIMIFDKVTNVQTLNILFEE